jgi:hypothetical protein
VHELLRPTPSPVVVLGVHHVSELVAAGHIRGEHLDTGERVALLRAATTTKNHHQQSIINQLVTQHYCNKISKTDKIDSDKKSDESNNKLFTIILPMYIYTYYAT